MTERLKWYKYLQLGRVRSIVACFLFFNRSLSSGTKQFPTSMQGMKLIFFLKATRLLNFSKWYPIQKKLVAIFKEKQTFFYAVSVLDRTSKMKLGKRSFMCHKVDSRMDDIQPLSSPKSKMASSQRLRCMCCVLETNLKRKFAADLLLQIFLAHYIFR